MTLPGNSFISQELLQILWLGTEQGMGSRERCGSSSGRGHLPTPQEGLPHKAASYGLKMI